MFRKDPAEANICKQSSKRDETLWLFGSVQSKEYSQSHQDKNKHNPENKESNLLIILPLFVPNITDPQHSNKIACKIYQDLAAPHPLVVVLKFLLKSNLKHFFLNKPFIC